MFIHTAKVAITTPIVDPSAKYITPGHPASSISALNPQGATSDPVTKSTVRFDPMAEEFVPGVTVTTSLSPFPRANEFTPRQQDSYPGALNTPAASFAFRQRYHQVDISSISDPVHQCATPSNPLAPDFVAGASVAEDEEMPDAPAAVEAVVTAKLHAFHHASVAHQAPLKLRGPVLTPEKVKAAAYSLVNARTPRKLPSEVGRAAQPAKVDVSQPRSTTGGSGDEMQAYLMYMAGLTNEWIHHINWCDKAMFKKSATSPAVSLCVIIASPKKEVLDLEINLCTSVLLHNALHLVDRIRFDGDFEVLNSCPGAKLQKAVIGSCHKFYNERGCLLSDEWEADEDIPVLDTMTVRDYETKDTVLNGWFNDNNVPVRQDVLCYSAKFAKQYHVARKLEMEEIPSNSGEAMQQRVVRKPFVKSSFIRSCTVPKSSASISLLL